VELPKFFRALIRLSSRLHAAWLRRFRGRSGGFRNTLILVTRGRKSGREFEAPLLYVREAERLYVVASFGGHDDHPNWYKNLLANPDVAVEIDGERRSYRARTLEPEEASRIWPKLLALWPAYASYQKRTTRLIPIVELSPRS
jgi:deazaflavin-dependent oxidoreductase (nitroreductase family)